MDNASKINGDPNKIYTIGGSAGGGLAFQVANQVLRDDKLKKTLKGIIALVPLTVHPDNVPEKYKSQYTAFEDNAKDVPVIDRESMEIFYKHAGADPKDSSLFTLLATDKHAEFPPTYFASCEFDPLRDDSKVMEQALKEAGVPTKHDYWPGFPHYFWIFPPVPESQGERSRASSLKCHILIFRRFRWKNAARHRMGQVPDEMSSASKLFPKLPGKT